MPGPARLVAPLLLALRPLLLVGLGPVAAAGKVPLALIGGQEVAMDLARGPINKLLAARGLSREAGRIGFLRADYMLYFDIMSCGPLHCNENRSFWFCSRIRR
jgi:hypothetical protein